MRTSLLVLLLACVLPVLAAPTGWRMDGTGHFPTAVPPAKWSATEGVVWATALPAWSNASPVLVGERIFLCAEPATLLCLDKSGKILWQHANSYEDLMSADEQAKLAAERAQLAELTKQQRALKRDLPNLLAAVQQADTDLQARPDDAALKTALATAKDTAAKQQARIDDLDKQKAALPLAAQYQVPPTQPANGYTSDTPVTDGKCIYASFGNGVVACYTLDGTRQWARLIEKTTHIWGHSCSPVLVGGTLVVQYIDMFALDAASGRELWRRKQRHDWGTPAPAKIGGVDVLLTDAGDLVNVADGKPLATTGFRIEYGSPLLVGDIAYCASGKNAAAFKLAPADGGGVQVVKLWQTAIANDRYYASPLLDNDLLYVVNQRSVLSVIDAKTGEKQYEQKLELGGTAYPSPVLDGNCVILSSDTGKSVLLTPGRTYQEIARCTLEPFRTTPVPDGKRLYIRTTAGKSMLYCLGE